MTEHRIESHSPEDTKAIAEQFVATVVPRADRATLIGLSGELGAGKTAFTQGIGAALGITDDMPSPTFILMRQYTLPDQLSIKSNDSNAFTELVHIDAYRLESPDQIAHLDFEELLKKPHTLIIVEWPELLGDKWPQVAPIIRFEQVDEMTRVIVFPS